MPSATGVPPASCIAERRVYVLEEPILVLLDQLPKGLRIAGEDGVDMVDVGRHNGSIELDGVVAQKFPRGVLGDRFPQQPGA